MSANQAKISAVAECYCAWRRQAETPEQAENSVRSLSTDCDMYQIRDGIALGKKLMGDAE